MKISPLLVAPTLLAAGDVAARDIPQNVRDLYNSIRDKASCSDELATGFYAIDNGPDTFSYCGDHLSDGVIYIQGRRGALADMDVDCDGVQGGPQDDGRCSFGRSPDYQDTTAFQDVVAGYNAGIQDLNTYVHPYVVFGNTGSKPDWRVFDPTQHGIRPLSVVAVVCGDMLVYGVWGDTNGDDGDHPMVGEASLALATACEGTAMSGSNGYSQTDILYLAFKGDDAVPGAKGANWTAADYGAFEASIQELGDRLVERIGSGASSAHAQVPWAAVLGAMLAGMVWVAI
ncbi:fungal chitosanase of glycosyl hydrolase group 75-domain-containing protein [Lasiosphaeria hispida]|uniref:Endo-chitosanase n=1 Tax=Lasiosphaeria hispida TaxID=260671 RepID=A0AAJ0H825_9PEZI|nr:fungal chitosanase of glycosyl hydrolase group 75-domain-containing protein [Lasiosphaeria hispida]